MLDQFSRTELLLGQDATEKLRKKKVIVFGIGGVGGYAVEALARSGVGRIDLYGEEREERGLDYAVGSELCGESRHDS